MLLQKIKKMEKGKEEKGGFLIKVIYLYQFFLV